MKSVVRTAFLLLLLTLNACAYLTSLRSDLVTQIDDLIKEQEYGQAMAALEFVKPDHPQYKTLLERRKKLKPLIQQLEQKIIKEATLLKDKGAWHEAIQNLHAGMRKLPDSQVLDETLDEFTRQREKYVQELEFNLLISRGEQLVRDLPFVKEIKRVIPHNWSANTTLYRIENDASDTAEALVGYSERAIQRKDYELAERCLTLAESLLPDKKTRHRLLLARNLLEKHQQKQERKELTKKLKQNKQLVTEFNEAFRTRKLAEARIILKKLQQQEVKAENLDELETKLNEAIQTRIKEGIATGRSLYTQGKIKQAVKEWEDARLLDPQNKELTEHIERAQRVLKKLEKLSDGQPPPPG